jgi:hypothetical protein
MGKEKNNFGLDPERYDNTILFSVYRDAHIDVSIHLCICCTTCVDIYVPGTMLGALQEKVKCSGGEADLGSKDPVRKKCIQHSFFTVWNGRTLCIQEPLSGP